MFVCLLGHLRCDVGVMSDRLFLSPPRSSNTKARHNGKATPTSLLFIVLKPKRTDGEHDFYTYSGFKTPPQL